MCKCTPGIRTPFCGKPGCEWPKQVFNLGRVDTKDALDVLEMLREKIISGEVVSFIGVAIHNDDSTTAWASATQHVTRLKVMGAISRLQYNYLNDDI